MKFIVNLTSFDKRVKSVAPQAIASLLDQTERPDHVILWLTKDTEVTPSLLDLVKVGLEIKYCEDFKSYNKLIPALLSFPNDILITADDDAYYPKNWFSQLKNSYLKNPNCIHVHRAHEIGISEDGHLLDYKDWKFCINKIENDVRVFPTGVGGILYPPKSLHNDVLKFHDFLTLAPKGDDIWFWAMAVLNETKYKLIENGYVNIVNVDSSDTGMWVENVYHLGNDIQFVSILDNYPKLIEHLEESLNL